MNKEVIVAFRYRGLSERKISRKINKSKIIVHHFLGDAQKGNEKNRGGRPSKLPARMKWGGGVILIDVTDRADL